MAQPFLEQLEALVKLHLSEESHLTCRHFFSGAALYSSGVICVSLTPVGLAFKLPEDVRSELIGCGAASKLKYFDNSPIKKGYVLFSDVEAISGKDMAGYIRIAVAHVRAMKV
jgi:hypothetical protein